MKQCILLLGLVSLLIGCQKDEPRDVLELSADSITLDNEEHVVKLAVKSNVEWKVSGAIDWCRSDKSSGSGDDSLVLRLDANLLTRERNATLVVQARELNESIRIVQQGSEAGYRYKLPVIFHVLYDDPTDRKQNVPAPLIQELIRQCNARYADATRSVDINVEFVLATRDPEGALLREPGIKRISWPSSVTMDCDVFMKDKKILPYIWDVNKYINIFVYSFSNKNVLGISYLPYTISGDALEGLNVGDYYLANPISEYPHCLSLNNEFIPLEHKFLQVLLPTLTLTHELGHYLGLFHVFTDKENSTDYCDDTETYDRSRYEKWVNSLPGPLPFTELAVRTTPEGKKFTSYNIMDYDISYQNQFTPGQRKRMRHVLENSPLIPGPKNKTNRSRSNPDLEKPEARTIKWERK